MTVSLFHYSVYRLSFAYNVLTFFIMSSNTSNNNANGYSFGNPPPMGNPATGAIVGTLPPPAQREPMRNYRGDSLLQPHRMRERMRNKEVMLGFGMGLGSPDIARWVAWA